MRFTVSCAELNKRLAVMIKVTVSNSTMPLTQDFLLTVKDDQLFMRATDMESVINTHMPLIDADENFNFTIPAKTFYDSIKELSDQPIRFELDPETLALTIEYSNGKFNFVATTVNTEQFPILKDADNVQAELTIGARSLLKGISSTIFATGDDPIRPIMNGIVLDIKENNVTFVATDAHKLVRLINTRYGGKMYGTTAESGEVLVVLRKKPMALIKSILSKDDYEVHFTFGANNWTMHMPDYEMSSLLIEGRFPNYNAVIPQNNPYTLWVDRLTLLAALKRVSICADEASNLVRMEIKDNNIQISAQSLDYSSFAVEDVPCQFDGSNMLIGFKADYLMTMLSNIETNDVVIKLSDAARAALVLPAENDEGEDLLMLLMPMMIKA